MNTPPRRSSGSAGSSGSSSGTEPGRGAEPSARDAKTVPPSGGFPAAPAASVRHGAGDAVDDLVAALGARPKPPLPRPSTPGALQPLSSRKHEPTVMIAPPSTSLRLARWTAAGLLIAAMLMGGALLIRDRQEAAAPPAPPIATPVVPPRANVLPPVSVAPPAPPVEASLVPRAVVTSAAPVAVRSASSRPAAAPSAAARAAPSAPAPPPSTRPNVPGLEDLKTRL
jgi:hypothetical protein